MTAGNLKQRDLGPCAACGKGCFETGPTCYRLTVERHVADTRAMQRQIGLGQLLGGAHALASVMGPDEDMTARLEAPVTVLLCQECGCGLGATPVVPQLLLEAAAENAEETS